MPTLPNARHERFAQELASGKSLPEAYEVAGFESDRHNAAKLQHSSSISERVSELLAEREKIHGQATAAAVERVALVISGTEKVGKINMLAAQAMAI